MSEAAMLLMVVIAPILLCLLLAFCLAFKGREGWGWFLFIAFIIVINVDNIMSVVRKLEL